MFTQLKPATIFFTIYLAFAGIIFSQNNPTIPLGDTLGACVGDVVRFNLPNAIIDSLENERIKYDQTGYARLVDSLRVIEVNTSSLIQGEYTIIYTIFNKESGEANALFTLMVYSIPSDAQAGDDKWVCFKSYELEAVEPSIGKGVWSSNISGITFINDSLPNTVVNNLPVISDNQQMVPLYWSVSNGVCPLSIDTVLIIIPAELTEPKIEVSSEGMCVEGFTVFHGNAPNFANHEQSSWAVLQADDVTLNAFINDTVATAYYKKKGEYTFFYEIGYDLPLCKSKVSAAFVRVEPNLSFEWVSPNFNEITMKGDELAVELSSYVSLGSEFNYQWKILEGDAIIDSIASNQFLVQELAVEDSLDRKYTTIQVCLESSFNLCPTYCDTLAITQLHPRVGLERSIAGTLLSVMPNPLVERSLVEFPNEEHGEFDLVVYNELGKQILSQLNISGNAVYLFRNDFLPGIYLFCLKGDYATYRGKFIVE